MFEFRTIKNEVSEVLLKEKGSKFLGFAMPVNSEEDIKKSLGKIRDIHPKATHHCYAFRLGINGENYRANDDGEPSGSAGLPIFNQLLANQITNILLVVMRYYGGTKLGVSGLVKAYKESAKLTLEQTEIITKELETAVKIKFGYAQQSAVFSLLNKFNAQISNFISEADCVIETSVKNADLEKFTSEISEIKNCEIL